MNNDNKIKKALSSEPVPDSLSPENIKKMLDEKAPAKKEKKHKNDSCQIYRSGSCLRSYMRSWGLRF